MHTRADHCDTGPLNEGYDTAQADPQHPKRQVKINFSSQAVPVEVDRPTRGVGKRMLLLLYV